jgi:hypothetical protein
VSNAQKHQPSSFKLLQTASSKRQASTHGRKLSRALKFARVKVISAELGLTKQLHCLATTNERLVAFKFGFQGADRPG